MFLPQFYSHQFQSPACRISSLQHMAEMEQNFQIKLPFSSAPSDLGAANEAIGTVQGSICPREVTTRPQQIPVSCTPGGESGVWSGERGTALSWGGRDDPRALPAHPRLQEHPVPLSHVCVPDFGPGFLTLALPLDVQAVEQTQSLLPKPWGHPEQLLLLTAFPSLSHFPLQTTPHPWRAAPFPHCSEWGSLGTNCCHSLGRSSYCCSQEIPGWLSLQ